MININFKKLAITNFMSIGEEPVVIDFTPGTHIITGENLDKPDRRNGTGKSSVIHAFYYAIIGQPISNIKKEFISNNITGKGGKVSLTFEVVDGDNKTECKIERSVKPAKCSFIVDGVDKTRDSIVNTNSDICKMLKLTPEILQNCVIMSLNETIPFMSQSKNDKREFIENIFRLEIFNKMFADAKTEYNSYKKDLDIQQNDKQTIENQILDYKTKQEKAKLEVETKIKQLNETIQQNIDKISTTQNKIDNEKTPDISDVENQRNILEGKLNKCNLKDKKYRETLGELNALYKVEKNKLDQLNDIKTKCPTCGRPFDDVDPEELEKMKIDIQSNMVIKSNDITELKCSINDVQKAVDIINQKLSNLTQLEKDHNKSILNIQLWKSEIEKCELTIKSAKENIENLQNSTIQLYDDLINEHLDTIKQIEIKIDDLKKVVYIADMFKFITSEEGVKAYLIKKIIEVFNIKLDYYIKKLDGNSIIKFNEFFDETITNMNGKQCSYNNFSGAERKAIDLACLFTFMDMRSAQGNVSYNVSFYDELFDSSLDEKGIKKVVDVLTDRVNTNSECVYVVTHRGEIMDFATGDTIMLQKKNGITTRVKS